MRVLLIYCHPSPDSFCAAARDAAVTGLREAGHAVEIHDLYAENFQPTLNAEERGHYYDETANVREVADHVAALRRAEALVLVYPTWWWSMPAMLKGWLDRVWVPGVAFRLGGPGVLQPLLTNIRRIGVVTTYGSPRWLVWLMLGPDRRVVAGLRHNCARRCQVRWLSLTRMDNNSLAQRRRFLARVRERFAKW